MAVTCDANMLRLMNDNDFLVILSDDVKYPSYASTASALWREKVYPKLPGYLEIVRYYFRYWTKERIFPDPEYSVMIFRGTVDAVYNFQRSSERAVWLVNDTVVKLLEDRYKTIGDLFHGENIYDLRDLKIDSVTIHHIGGRHNGKTERITQSLLESADLRCEPFPDYKYNTAAYQNIVASREAMERAEHGDITATTELINNFMNEKENENMKNTISTTIDQVNISRTEMGYNTTDVELTFCLYPSDANRFGMAFNKAFHAGRKPKISINLDGNCDGVIDLFPVKAEKVIFNNPATIVIWSDGTKTVVKKQKGDRYNKQTGLALCYMKKALGNGTREFNDALKEGLGEK